MYLRLDKLVAELGIAPSRARAQAMIGAGKISVNGVIVKNSAKEFPSDAEIFAVEADIPWVSRAALKLIAALDAFAVDPTNRVVLDIGSSTGGFTEVVLSRGAKYVYAVDVGTGQLHERLRGDARVDVREGTHIKDVTPEDLKEAPTLVVIDVSFISLDKVLPKASELLAPHGDIVALVKPQFEVGKEHIGKGVVRDPLLHEAACDKIVRVLSVLGFVVGGPIPSPVVGGDGNVEFLVHGKR